MNATTYNPRDNGLIAVLPQPVQERWLPHLELADMRLGRVMYESGATLSHVYFPITAIVSLLYVMENGSSAEIAIVGNEGVVGISLFMGGGSTPSRAVVQSAGYGFRLKAETLQMARTAVCNRHHSLDQQLCRWLLLRRSPQR